MKWLLLTFVPFAVLVAAAWLRRHPAQIPLLWVTIGLGPFVLQAIPHLVFAIVAWPDWPGYTKGIEVSVLDIAAFTLYLSLPRVHFPLPFKGVAAFYLFVVVISAFQADEPLATLCYAWQLLRLFFFFAVIFRSCEDPRFIPSVFAGAALGLAMQGMIVVWQKFGLHLVQPTGTFDHQNLLGMLAYLFAIPMFALLLAGYRHWSLVVGVGSCAVIAALIASRGAVALTAGGFALTFVLSVWRGLTMRKGAIAMIGMVGVLAILPLALSSLENRFALSAVTRVYDERVALEYAASLIVEDHSFGIGANNFASSAVSQGYMQRAMVSQATLRLISPHVHNAYWLAAAEVGYLGLLGFVLLLARPLQVAFACGWRNKGDLRGELLVGIAVALLMIYIQASIEWVIFLFVTEYALALVFGVIGGLAYQLGYWRRAPLRTLTPAPGARALG